MVLVDRYTKDQLEKIVSRSFSMVEVERQLGYTSRNGKNAKTIISRLEHYNISREHFTHKPHKVRSVENIFIPNNYISSSTLKIWYKKGNYSEYKCAICGLVEWQDKDIVLTLDHINGDNSDNRIENLRWICPNCDRQLPTYANRNRHRFIVKKKYFCIDCGVETSEKRAKRCVDCWNEHKRKVERPDRKTLKDLIRTKSFIQIGNDYGVSDNAVRKWCKTYDLPFKSLEIRKITDNEWVVI